MKWKLPLLLAGAMALGGSQPLLIAQPGSDQSTATAPAEAEVLPTAILTRVRRPPKEFLELGDVVGVSADLLVALRIREGDPILVVTPMGRRHAFETKVHGTDPAHLYAKETLRTAMGIEEGAVRLTVSPVRWPAGQPADTQLQYTKVSRPPKEFLKFDDAIGISYERFVELNVAPGAKAVMTGPKGQALVEVQLLDRGHDVVSMRQTLRDKIGVTEHGGEPITIKVIAAAPATSTRTP